MTDLDLLAPDFVEAAHTLVYCSVSTVDPVDPAGRPRSRVMHPIWERDGRRLTGPPGPTRRRGGAADVAGRRGTLT